jgi:hypothetical protein
LLQITIDFCEFILLRFSTALPQSNRQVFPVIPATVVGAGQLSAYDCDRETIYENSQHLDAYSLPKHFGGLIRTKEFLALWIGNI